MDGRNSIRMVAFEGHFYLVDHEQRIWKMKIDENADWEVIGTMGDVYSYIFAIPYNYWKNRRPRIFRHFVSSHLKSCLLTSTKRFLDDFAANMSSEIKAAKKRRKKNHLDLHVLNFSDYISDFVFLIIKTSRCKASNFLQSFLNVSNIKMQFHLSNDLSLSFEWNGSTMLWILSDEA